MVLPLTLVANSVAAEHTSMVDKYTVPKNPIVYDNKSSTSTTPAQFPSGNDAEHRTYIGPNFPPQAYPQPAHEGSQSTSPSKDYP